MNNSMAYGMYIPRTNTCKKVNGTFHRYRVPVPQGKEPPSLEMYCTYLKSKHLS